MQASLDGLSMAESVADSVTEEESDQPEDPNDFSSIGNIEVWIFSPSPTRQHTQKPHTRTCTHAHMHTCTRTHTQSHTLKQTRTNTEREIIITHGILTYDRCLARASGLC